MGWGKLAILSVCLLAGCVGKNSPSQACDPQTEDCSVGPGGTGRRVRDSDCGDGICQPDGTCRAVQPVTQPTACANVSCPAGNFCSNGQCIPATAGRRGSRTATGRTCKGRGSSAHRTCPSALLTRT